MPSESLSTFHLDYLQRSNLSPAPLHPRMPSTSAPPALRRLLRVRGIGRFRKAAEENPQQENPQQPMRLVSEDLLAGLYGYEIPLAFLLRGEPGSVAVHLGTWSPVEENASAIILEGRQEILSTVLHGLYPAIELERAAVELPELPLSGLVRGIPAAKPPDAFDAALPLDRLLRALSGTTWACLLLAQPIEEGATVDLRRSVINEMRSVEDEFQAVRGPSPLAEHYLEQLKAMLTALTDGQAVGAWRTAVYLLGDSSSYYRLSGVWRATFSGKDSRPEPVRK